MWWEKTSSILRDLQLHPCCLLETIDYTCKDILDYVVEKSLQGKVSDKGLQIIAL